ncbi:MAG TPA: Ig-like domain repeat protein [Candidatus Acidoferrales bacterium]|nr:Ig-like domain repeat protein [Candidatus Acidoferrales bacterium]
MRTKLLSRAIALACFALVTTLAHAQTWTTLTTRPPAGISLCMLLTDGGVMCQSGSAWYKLTPDSSGSYLNGAWSGLASLPSGYVPDAFASAVLADGRVVVVGGEYNNGNFALTNLGAIYDPNANTWTMLPLPPSTGSPNHLQCIGDAPAAVLADGRLLVGSKLFQDLAVLDPATLSWSIVSATGKTDGFNSEEGWTLLPDGSFFTLDVKNAPSSERFLLTGPAAGIWANSGNTLQDLHTPTTSGPITAPGCPVYNPPGEIGPTLLRPDGTVFAVGANGFTGIYTPPAAGSTDPGAWAQGPQLPSGLNVEDGPGAVLPSGHVLFGASPGATGAGLQYFEFDGASLTGVPAPARAASDATYFTSLLVLPSGQVMFVDGSTTVQLYTPAGSPAYDPAWAPTIIGAPPTVNNATTYQISGTQFNGLNQGTAFGDESQNPTNYPLVRIVNNTTGHVFYAKTHDHSSMGVATGSTTVFTNFDVPANIEAGAATLQVVANGIPSAAVAVTVVNPNNPTATAASSSPNPSVFGQLVTFISTTTSSAGPPAGTVTFTEGATVWASNVTVDAAGRASFSTTALAVASHTITATFTGTAGWTNSSGSAAPQVVHKAATATAVSSSANPSVFSQPVTFTATVAATAPGSGVPAGTVNFRNGNATLGTGTLNGSGIATFTTSTLAVGTHSITAVYGGSTGFNTSTSLALTQTVNKDATTTTVTSSFNPSVHNQSVTFTATVAANAPGTARTTGTVTFKDGARTLRSVGLSAGHASFTTSTLSTGAHQITAVYGGSSSFLTSTSPVLVQTVN